MNPTTKLREQLQLRHAQQQTEYHKLSPRERADLAKLRLRSAVQTLGVKHAVRRRPYLVLGAALGFGMLMGAVPGARKIAFKAIPALKRTLALLG